MLTSLHNIDESENACRLSAARPGQIYRVLSVPMESLDSFLDFFAAFFSFGVMAGFFLVSLLLFCSFDMVSLRVNVA
jgi:hypothetical protein